MGPIVSPSAAPCFALPSMSKNAFSSSDHRPTVQFRHVQYILFLHDLLLVRIAAPIAIVYKTKTRNARTTFLNSSTYLNLLHLECVSESGCSSLCQLHSKNDRTHTFNRQQVYLQPLLGIYPRHHFSVMDA